MFFCDTFYFTKFPGDVGSEVITMDVIKFVNLQSIVKDFETRMFLDFLEIGI